MSVALRVPRTYISTKLGPKHVSAEELKKIFGGPAPLNSKKPGGMGSGH